jgi:hypothetical protein
VIDYYLGAGASGPVKLEILDAAGSVVRHYSSDDPVDPVDPMLDVPAYWLRPARPLAATPGLHRFLWDLHYQPLRRRRAQLPIAAIFRDTAPPPNSPWVLPGTYRVRLTVGDKSFTELLTVKLDPRVHTSVTAQFTLSKAIYDDVLQTTMVLGQMRDLREKIQQARAKAGVGATADLLDPLDKKLLAIEGNPDTGRGGGGGRFAVASGPDTLTSVSTALAALMQAVQKADTPPTSQQAAATRQKRAALAQLMQRWKSIQTVDLPGINQQLAKARLTTLEIEKDAEAVGMDDDDDADDIG